MCCNKRWVMAAALCGALVASSSATAETWFFTSNEGTGGDHQGYTTPALWKNAAGTEAAAFSATDSYVVSNGVPGSAESISRQFYLNGGTFAGGTITAVGVDGTHNAQLLLRGTDANPCVVSKGIVLGKRAVLQAMASSGINRIHGDTTIAVANGGHYAMIMSRYKGVTLVFDGMIKGAAYDCGWGLMPHSVKGNKEFTIKFLGDVTTGGGACFLNNNGSNFDAASDKFGMRLVFGNIEFKAPIMQTPPIPAKFLQIGVNTANDTAKIYRLDREAAATGGLGGIGSLPQETTFIFPVDGANKKAGKIVLSQPLYGNTNACTYVKLEGDPFHPSETNRLLLLDVPASRPLVAASFKLAETSWTYPADLVKFEVTAETAESGARSRLYAVVPPLVRQAKSVGENWTANKPSEFQSASYWTDGKVPYAGPIYYCGSTNASATGSVSVRTPYGESLAYTFPSECLIMGRKSYMPIYSRTVHFTNLWIRGDAQGLLVNNRTATLTGKVRVDGDVADNYGDTGNVTQYGNGNLILSCEMRGTGANGSQYQMYSGRIHFTSATSLSNMVFKLNIPAECGIGVEPNLADETFTARGVDLTKGVSFRLNPATFTDGKIVLKNPITAPKFPGGMLDVGLFTVKTSEKDAFAALLPATPPSLFSKDSGKVISSWYEPKDNGDGTTTFGVHAYKDGFILFIR